MVNPIGLKGQIHGGVVQGLGQALVSSRRAGVLAAKTSPTVCRKYAPAKGRPELLRTPTSNAQLR